MADWTKPLVDMEMDDEDQTTAGLPIAMEPERYPYGLNISLTDKELEKLDLSEDCEAGCMLHFIAKAKVRHVSKSDGTGGKSCRIELQIQKMRVVDDPDEDDD